jgi:hypothetical protein
MCVCVRVHVCVCVYVHVCVCVRVHVSIAYVCVYKPCCTLHTHIKFLSDKSIIVYVLFLLTSGFWDCYIVVREFIHETLRKELAFTSPDKNKELYFTGHSLGGVIASFAALDFVMHSKDRIDKFSRHQKLRYYIMVYVVCIYHNISVLTLTSQILLFL